MIVHKKNNNYLVFVGSGRTGSTLVGQLLNKHPNIAISSELRVLTNALKKNKKVKKYLKKIEKVSLSETRVPHKYKNDELNEQFKTWQKDWKTPDEEIIYKYPKKEIYLYGDKKQGGNTEAFIENENKVFELLDGLNLKFFSIVRHPYSVLNSYKQVGYELNSYIDKYIKIQKKSLDLIEEQCGLIVYYEELLSNPEKVLNSIFNFLNVEFDTDFISDVRQIINTGKNIKNESIPENLKKKVDSELPGLIENYKNLNEQQHLN
tara:strand:- start:5065 stop:5853 length:789 start_codon:yes stop_codon:yes gene_type:complete